MDLSLFTAQTGQLISINGSDPQVGAWEHKAFLPAPLPDVMPTISARTIMALANARSALAALDNTARHLPNPQLLRQPTLRREAQSTSALEGTYAPLSEVITADDDHVDSLEMREILNYVRMANYGFSAVREGRPVSKSLVTDLQGMLMDGTALSGESGRLRQSQVVIGRQADAPLHALPVHAARFVPPPPGDQLEAGVDDLMRWKGVDHSGDIDPLIKAGLSHYQFETLHPFRDGNGRLGRYLIVLDLLSTGLLSEPTLTVSPWFEARRGEYYDHLLRVSTQGDWDSYLRFFVSGLQQAAESTHQQMLALSRVQGELKDEIRASNLRGESAHAVIDLATGQPTFTIQMVAETVGLSKNGARNVLEKLMDLKIIALLDPENTYRRRYYAPQILRVLLGDQDTLAGA